MKLKLWSRIVFLGVLACLNTADCFGNNSQDPGSSTYYYYRGEKIPLKYDRSRQFAIFTSANRFDAFEATAQRFGERIEKYRSLAPLANVPYFKDETPTGRLPLNWSTIDGTGATSSLDEAAITNNLLYRGNWVILPNGSRIATSNYLYVKLQRIEDVELLRADTERLKTVLYASSPWMPLWHLVAVNIESNGDSIHVANTLYETGRYAAAEPDFLISYELQCTSDPRFPNQWGLNNTMYSDIDIGICDAWSHSTGMGARIGIIDQPVKVNHPDLYDSTQAPGYDTTTMASPCAASLLGPNHGTRVAGVAGANRNSIGMAGVAPDADLVCISNPLSSVPGALYQLAQGFAWAWQNDIHVINNSWGVEPSVSTPSQIIEDAIEDALTLGRGGDGCVVVFASGNGAGSSEPVHYPGNFHPDILNVGAIARNGIRISSSSYSPELDMVAPGRNIETTTIVKYGSSTFYYSSSFGFTSAAAPHVSGVAALILEVRPDLTQQEVGTIIERSCKELPHYTYTHNASRPNGRWNLQTGYGLIDAGDAVQAAKAHPK